MTSELAWKIIKGGLTMPEKLNLLFPDKAKEIMDEISETDKQFCYAYFETANHLAYLAYAWLVDEGEIPKDKMFNLNQRVLTKEFPNESYMGDIGYKNKELYRYTQDKWIKC